MKFPTVIASSVVRSSHKGESHGGVYVIDLEGEIFEKVIDWNKSGISWEGRGGERGLRGIDFHDNKIYLAASDEIFVYNQEFDLMDSIKNEYFKTIHEIIIYKNLLYITSSGFDSVLIYNLNRKKFICGYCVKQTLFEKYLNTFQSRFSKLPKIRFVPKLLKFDPNKKNQIKLEDTTHLNYVHVNRGGIFISGTKIGYLTKIKDDRIKCLIEIPYGTHNLQPYRSGIIYNNTPIKKIIYYDCRTQIKHHFNICKFNKSELINNNLPLDVAKPGFARGLCMTNNGLIIGGCSPATISVYKMNKPNPIKIINLSMDVRNAIHGLEILPYQ